MTDPIEPQDRRILIIDDEENMRHMLELLLSKQGYSVTTAGNGAAALDALEENAFDLILCDLRMPVMDGMAFLDACREKGVDATIIMMSAFGTIDIALQAMKKGAYDYISKPFKSDEVILTLRKAEERERLRRENLTLKAELGERVSFHNIVAKSRAMREIFRTIEKISGFRTTVLLQGESGTGKELVARALHHNSPRSRAPFVPVNCGAIPHALLESELFGHVKGAFTDAVRDRHGLFAEAHGGTLFLDEVGELPLDLQVKLLRVLQEQEVRPVGGGRARAIDVRIVSASIQDLEEEVRRDRFRSDLFYRLNVVTLKIPPLQERTEDIPLLVEHFIKKHRERLGLDIEGITKSALRYLIRHPWPGNVRELENAIERAMVLCERRSIDVRDLTLGQSEGEGSNSITNDLHLKSRTKALERDLIQEALKRTGGNRTHAAGLLGITQRALLYKLQAVDLGDGEARDL